MTRNYYERIYVCVGFALALVGSDIVPIANRDPIWAIVQLGVAAALLVVVLGLCLRADWRK